jgi:drug efflux transport system permease protein
MMPDEPPVESEPSRFSFQRATSVARKEMLHILRDATTLFFSLFVPVVELLLLGYAIDTNVRYVPTVIFDAARTQESRTLIKSFENTEDFVVVSEVFSDLELTRAIVAGTAHVGIKIPEDYSRQTLAGQTAQLLILVDGSQSSVAASAVGDGNAIALRESLRLVLGSHPLPVEARPVVLFNPDTRSANYFIPGLLVVMCQMMAVMLTSNSIVREKENGTLEQLFMTPVRASELMVGKLIPYLFLTIVEFCLITFLMRFVFQVPIHGSFLTLLFLGLPFIVGMLGVGLLISTRAATRDASMQLAMGTVIPSIFLSGYVFPVESMPQVFRYLSNAVPTTWMIDAARGVILRGAGLPELRSHALVLWMMALVMMFISTISFKKRLT